MREYELLIRMLISEKNKIDTRMFLHFFGMNLMIQVELFN